MKQNYLIAIKRDSTKIFNKNFRQNHSEGKCNVSNGSQDEDINSPKLKQTSTAQDMM